MDGIDIDLVEWCGLAPLTDDQWDRVWGNASPITILENCIYAEWETTAEFDEMPGFSDRYFKITVDNSEDLDTLKQEVREQVEKLLAE